MNTRYKIGRWYHSRGYRPQGPADETTPAEPTAYSRTRKNTTFGTTVTDNTNKKEKNDGNQDHQQDQ